MKRTTQDPFKNALQTLRFVRLLTDPHTNSRVNSQGELLLGHRVTEICEASEAIFLKLKEERKG